MMRFVILSVALLIATAGATNVKQCKDNKPFPLSVKVEGCETLPCDVVKGTTAVMYVHFVNTKGISYDIQAKVRATTIGITVPYELPQEVSDVCSNLMYNAKCPLYQTEDVVYKFNFYIDNSYPEISVKVEVSLNNEDNESLACFVTDIKVKKGATPNEQLE